MTIEQSRDADDGTSREESFDGGGGGANAVQSSCPLPATLMPSPLHHRAASKIRGSAVVRAELPFAARNSGVRVRKERLGGEQGRSGWRCNCVVSSAV